MSYGTKTDYELQKIYYGDQDKYFETMTQSCPEWFFLEKRKCIVSKDATTIAFETYDDYPYGYANFRILSNIDSIEQITLWYNEGNNKFDSYISNAYPNILRNEHPFDCMNYNVIPVKKNSYYFLKYKSTNDFEIEYFICKIIRHHHLNKYSYMVNDYLANDSDTISGETVKCKINHNHPVKRIIIKSSEKLSNIKIILDEKYCVTNFTEIAENCYERIFAHTVNFSRIEAALLIADREPDAPLHGTINVIVENKNIYYYFDGLSGLLFKN